MALSNKNTCINLVHLKNDEIGFLIEELIKKGITFEKTLPYFFLEHKRDKVYKLSLMSSKTPVNLDTFKKLHLK